MKKILIAGVIGFGLILSGCGKSEAEKAKETVEMNEIDIESKTGEWQVVVNRDEMRNTESKWLALRSSNNADLNFPYDGENRLQLDILDSKSGSARIFLTIDKGQYDCGSYGCSVSIKFGNNPVQDVRFHEYDTQGSDGTILVLDGGSSKPFLQNIRTFKTIIVEVPFYSNGLKQFKFNTKKFNEAEKQI